MSQEFQIPGIRLLVLTSLLCLSSCTIPVTRLQGFRWPPRHYEYERVVEFGERLGISPEQMTLLDSAIVTKEFKHLDSNGITDSLVKIEFLFRFVCPIQVMYFDKDQKLVSQQSVCHSGLPKKWNFDRLRDNYPPITEYSVDSLSMDLDELNEYLLPRINLSEVQGRSVLVFWPRTFWRPSRKLINGIRPVLDSLEGDERISSYYVNMDLFKYQKM